jgi:site-specific recombinase XerD
MTTNKSLTLAEPKTLTEGANVRALARLWLDSLALQVRAGELSDASRRTYQIGLEKFLTWTDRRKAVSDDVIREWIADLRDDKRTPTTINTWLAGVRSFFAWAFRNRHLPYNPTNGIHGAKRSGTSKKHRRDALTDREVLRVLDTPNVETPEGKRDAAILAVMAYCAARQSDLQRADLDDLQTIGGRLVLAVRGKGRAEKDEVLVIAHPDAEGALRDWLAARGDEPGALFVSLSNRTRGARLSSRAIRDIVKRHFKNAGVRGDRKTTHSLRHTAITNAVKHGAPVQKVQAMARHANIATTMIYYHETDRVENPAEQFIRYDDEKSR